ncbi:MAG TPA: transketolase, partial [Actinomycetales bacterium]|nr:transketolase [Actinomycetales bacterium]
QTEVLVLTEGICTEEALRALPIVRERGVAVRHLHISTLKPFDDPVVLEALAGEHRVVITMENHLRVGGLGSAVAEVLAEQGAGVPLIRLGLDDTYAHGASQKYLLAEYGLDANALVRAVERGLGRDLGIDESDLAEVRVVDVHSSAKAEAL